MRISPFGFGSFAIVVAVITGLTGLQALADSSLSALPKVGASQTLSVSQKFTPGAPLTGSAPRDKGAQNELHNQSGTLTITRVASDSVRFSASNGLDAFDQTLHVDSVGTVVQSSANTFVDALDTVAATLAAAPTKLQKGSKWTTTVATPSWINNYMNGTLPKSASSIPVDVKVASVTGDTAELIGVGSVLFSTETAPMNTIGVVFECTLRAAQIKSCSRTTNIALDFKPNVPSGFAETTTLSAQ